VTGMHASLPESVNAWLDSPAAAGLRDPQSVLNPSANAALRDQLAEAFPAAPQTADLVLGAIRDSLGSALHLVFGLCAAIMLCGLVGSVVWRDIPLRRKSGPTRPPILSMGAPPPNPRLGESGR
jgi:hypothetical protein